MFTPPELTKEMKKEIWGDGPWVDEPDYLEFSHNGVNCVVLRLLIKEGPKKEFFFGGHFCGYVQIPKENNLYRKKDEIIEEELSVHGGITFDECINEGHWVGFDCGHYDDIVPSMMNQEENRFFQDLKKEFPDFTPPKKSYKTWDFVVEETKKLAEQVMDYK